MAARNKEKSINGKSFDLVAQMESLYTTLDYYISLPPRTIKNPNTYWSQATDPDGQTRNRLNESRCYLTNLSEELNFIRALRPGKMLDIGCGPGWLLSAIDPLWDKHGIEPSREAAAIAAKHAKIYSELFEEVDVSSLVESKGIMYFWTNKDLKSRELEIEIRKELGVEQQLLSPHEIHDLEPHIKKIYHGGILYPQAKHARNPRKILLKLFDLFIKKGGIFKKENVETINFSTDNKPRIIIDSKSYIFEKAVVACGAFSKRLTDQVDEKIPLDTERGYHVHFKGHDHLLSRPVIFLNRGFGITPMEQGLRVVGTVEFGGLDNPPSKKRITNLVNNAKYLFPELGKHEDEWLGFRPSLPDFLPVIGASKNHKNLFYSFGHHHLGWTLGAISGKIIAGLVAGENTNLDLTPYNSKRFV